MLTGGLSGLESSMTFSPIIFIAGPSGAGKSTISEWIVSDLHLLHLDIDCHHGFGFHGLRREWHLFSTRLDPGPLASAVRDRIKAARSLGAVLSFPSNRILSQGQIEAAKSVGICTVIIWGPENLCKQARRDRDCAIGQLFEEERYEKSNRTAFTTYGSVEYAHVRVEAFRPDGSRWSRADMVRAFSRLPKIPDAADSGR